MKWAIAEEYSLDDVLASISENRVVYALTEEDGNYHLVRADRWEPDRHTLGAFRQIEPLKSLLFRPREFLGAWTGQNDREPMAERIVIGVKNCDLSALAVHDDVFLNGDIQDPLYAEAREKTILVTADCTGCRDVCFCPAVGEQPYPTQYFDINVSPTPMGSLLETGTDRGAEVLQAARPYLKPADDAIQRGARGPARGHGPDAFGEFRVCGARAGNGLPGSAGGDIRVPPLGRFRRRLRRMRRLQLHLLHVPLFPARRRARCARQPGPMQALGIRACFPVSPARQAATRAPNAPSGCAIGSTRSSYSSRRYSDATPATAAGAAPKPASARSTFARY